MEKIGKVFSKFTKDESELDDLPETKNQVFMLFQKRASMAEQRTNKAKLAHSEQLRCGSHSPMRARQSIDSGAHPPQPHAHSHAPQAHAHSHTPQAQAHSHAPQALSNHQSLITQHALEKPMTDQRAKSIEPSDASKVLSRHPQRRDSSFVKRGSISMEPIKKVDLESVYHVYKQPHDPIAQREKAAQLGTGRFGYIKLAEHKESKQKIAIKFFPRPQIKQADFVREYNYSFFLSPHHNIVDTYEGMMQTSDEAAFFFVQEFCPKASLREAVESSQNGIGEAATRQIFSGVMSAIEFMHSEGLVHRNLKAENILIFDNKNYAKVKVTDFGLTRKVECTVKYLEYTNQYHAPELCETVANEMLTVATSIDIWALGVIIYYCLKGKFPWQKASIMCKPYWEWEQWLKRKNPALPKRMLSFTEKGIKLYKKTLCPRPKDRWTAKELRKWIQKEKLVNKAKTDNSDAYHYFPEMEHDIEREQHKNEKEKTSKKSALQVWISNTLNTMTEISEQVVSAHD